VSSAEDVDGMIGAAIERHSTLDVLVNNAGIMDRFLPAAETPDELWERVLKVNLTGPSSPPSAPSGRCSRAVAAPSST
jgi:NAD(P)-dependent dehydrogenase (short-subunit alcohol dehydrogenase family)